MLAKRTTKNQLTLPRPVVAATGEADYYDVITENGRIILTPLRIQRRTLCAQSWLNWGLPKMT